MAEKADVGLIGLAVMGQNLVLNLADNGYSVAVFNRTTTTTEAFTSSARGAQDVRGTRTMAEFVGAIQRPRKIILLVKAGSVVDVVIEELVPLLNDGDIIIDGGNSRYTDTTRRFDALQQRGLLFVGAGVSGGEEGARYGPSIMPGGSREAWPQIEEMLQTVSAHAGLGGLEPCCEWIGPSGAGHYVKMIHNGIEYGDMQVLAEASVVLAALGQAPADIARTLRDWNQGRLESYLVEITAEVFSALDDSGQPLVERILDAAGQKGTGKWTVISAMELGQPMMLVAEAVGARMISSLVEMRGRASRLLPGPTDVTPENLSVSDIEEAVYASKLISYAQGFMLLGEASAVHGWALDLGSIARLWRGGCIIRASFLDDISTAYNRDGSLENLLFDSFFSAALATAQAGLRRTVVACAHAGIAIPAYASALTFYDGLRAARGSANVIQAQRDYFGAHTYERVDRPRGEWFHTDWAGTGGPATSGSYSA